MSLAFDAMMFARRVHARQARKYTGNPYADHLAEVAGIVASVGVDEFSIATAWLHDCVEDQGVTPFGLRSINMPEKVIDGVMLLSDLEPGNRAQRKEASRERLAGAPAWVQTIKCADLISNTSSIVKHDPQFAVVYMAEKRALLEVLTKADPRLHSLAVSMAGKEKVDG